MPRVGHPWRKHFCDARFIVMEVDTSVMIILVMSWNTSTTTQIWLSWFYHKFFMDVHAWQKTRPTVTNTYHHESVFFCSASWFIWWKIICLDPLWCLMPLWSWAWIWFVSSCFCSWGHGRSLVISNHVNWVFVRYFDDMYVLDSLSGVMWTSTTWHFTIVWA